MLWKLSLKNPSSSTPLHIIIELSLRNLLTGKCWVKIAMEHLLLWIYINIDYTCIQTCHACHDGRQNRKWHVRFHMTGKPTSNLSFFGQTYFCDKSIKSFIRLMYIMYICWKIHHTTSTVLLIIDNKCIITNVKYCKLHQNE